MNRPSTEGGYVGLLALLIGVALAVFIYVRMEFTPKPTIVVDTSGHMETTTTDTALQAAHQNIMTAEAMQEKMNQQNQDLNKALAQ